MKRERLLQCQPAPERQVARRELRLVLRDARVEDAQWEQQRDGRTPPREHSQWTSEQLSLLPAPLASQFGTLVFALYRLALLTTVLLVVWCILVLESRWEIHAALRLCDLNSRHLTCDMVRRYSVLGGLQGMVAGP